MRHSSTSHGDHCYCGRPARWHITYGSGCGNVCGIHRRVIERRKAGVTSTPLHPPCASCGGLCDWVDTFWVCRRCGDEWDADHGPEYAIHDGPREEVQP